MAIQSLSRRPQACACLAAAASRAELRRGRAHLADKPTELIRAQETFIEPWAEKAETQATLAEPLPESSQHRNQDRGTIWRGKSRQGTRVPKSFTLRAEGEGRCPKGGESRRRESRKGGTEVPSIIPIGGINTAAGTEVIGVI